MSKKHKSINFLPEVFKTSINKQFLSSTLDNLISENSFRRVEGYIGKKYGYNKDVTSYYVQEPNIRRANYQLQPSVVFLDNDTKKPKDFITYTGIIDALAVEGSNTNNHSSLFENEYYTWDPFVNIDKLANYQSYYWIPKGPNPIPVYIPIIYSSDDFIIREENNNLKFSKFTYTNPTIYLYRSGRYTFKTAELSGKFWIQKNIGVNVPDEDRVISGINNNNGTSTELVFDVPIKSFDEYVQDTLYYQHSNGSYGMIKLIDNIENPLIDINDIIGKKTYVSPNGIKFTNGLRIKFSDNVIQTFYSNKEYYIEGVGDSIKLLDATDFDSVNFDTTLQDYVTIHRASEDKNFWSRTNRWFHQEVIDITKQHLGQHVLDEVANNIAVRPIIEYKKNLKLFNSGLKSYGIIDYADNYYTDIFNQIENINVTANLKIDGNIIKEGDTVIFLLENNKDNKNYIFKIYFSDVNGEIVYKLHRHVEVEEYGTVNINNGLTYKNSSWQFKNESFIQSITKIKINQYPLFDVVDINNISLSDTAYYPQSTFNGSVLFSYQVGTGSVDPKLGFPLSYSSLENIGDINFENNYNIETFSYYDSDLKKVVTGKINDGYVITTESEKFNGWIKALTSSFQYQVFNKLAEKNGINVFKCDVPVKTVQGVSNIIVYINDTVLDKKLISYSVTGDNTYVELTASKDDNVTILLNSDRISKEAYYDYPINLENNTLNKNISTVSLGEVRNQYRSIFSNNGDTTGELFGFNNLHDLHNINRYGTAIIQSSSSLILPGLFLRSTYGNIFDALRFNSDQYTVYKTTILDLVLNGNYYNTDNTADVLDDVILKISSSKENTGSFFWTDMLSNGVPYATNKYNFAASTSNFSLLLSDIWNPKLYTEANFKSILLYVIDKDQKSTQLLKDIDYVINDETPTVYINATISEGQTLIVKEYNQTYGSYCPNTPTKLGLYPKFKPEIVKFNDKSIPAFFIRGHDGSLTKLYGVYDTNLEPEQIVLNDLRDSVLLEFEKRIFNNIKVQTPVPLTLDELMPGESRVTEHSWEEFLNLYSVGFLNWVGANKIDYRRQYYSNNEFKFNYNQSLTNTTIIKINIFSKDTSLNIKKTFEGKWLTQVNALSEVTNWIINTYPNYSLNDFNINYEYSILKQGNYRGINRWYYDTEDPSRTPWEMLGLYIKPSWWDIRYGSAPYTRANLYMWRDISNGYVWNDGNPYINKNRIRPNLLNMIPVDDNGELLSPLQTVVGNYNKLTFERDWQIGDGGPAESAYLNSSVWPFELMRLFALLKPAKFFNLCVDLDRYKTNSELQQILFDNKSRLSPDLVEIVSSAKPKHSYTSWIVDYINNSGENGINIINDMLSNVDIRLTYNVGGFTAKNYSKFFIERATPYSRNTSFLIPDENLSIILYNNPPVKKVQYSAVIVQKVVDGWAVWGYSNNQHYFKINLPKLSNYEMKTLNGISFKVPTDYYPGRTKNIPYGHVFYSANAVVEFLYAYGAYLESNGLIFDSISDDKVLNWSQIADEFIIWVNQKWIDGSIIILNPNAKMLKINNDSLVVQPMAFKNDNIILNQNLLPVELKNLCIDREQNQFSVKVLNPGDTISYATFKLDSIEHAVIFDNFTSFNDIIYSNSTGMRHDRLIVKGYKTDNWGGYIDNNGYILNENDIKEWEQNKKYPKNIIIKYKNNYYSAKKLIEPSITFNVNDWTLTDYDNIKSSMLPNPNTMSYESEHYYDLNQVNLEKDNNLLAFSLIGFRPREYLVAPDLSDTTHVNIYKNMLPVKGTMNAANMLDNIKIVRDTIGYDIYENWLIKNGQFGNINNNNFVQFNIKGQELSGNPALIGFTDGSFEINNVNATVNINDLINYERKPLRFDFLPTLTYANNELPSAGYVSLDDAKIREYNINDLLNLEDISNIYRNDYIWIADYKGSWDIFIVTNGNNQITQIDNNLNGTIKVTFKEYHELLKNDIIGIINFDSRINGFYVVDEIINLKTIVVQLLLSSSTTKIQGTGTYIKLISRRFNEPSEINDEQVNNIENKLRKYWIDNDVDNNWAVYAITPSYSIQNSLTNSGKFGSTVYHDTKFGTLVSDNNGKMYRYYGDNLSQEILGSGRAYGQYLVQITSSNDYLYCSDPSTKKILLYKLNSTTNILYKFSEINLSDLVTNFTGAIAVSKNSKWLYVANSIDQQVLLMKYKDESYTLVHTLIDQSVPAESGWGASIVTTLDGGKLFVSAPNEVVLGVNNAGAAYIYNRLVERILVSTESKNFNINYSLTINAVDVYVDGASVLPEIDYDNRIIKFQSTIKPGSVIELDMGLMKPVQRFQSNKQFNGALFSNSIDTNRYGAELIIGVPYEFTNIGNNSDVEGAVYRYTNSGQKYGTVKLINPIIYPGDQLIIDGYHVNFVGVYGNALSLNSIKQQIELKVQNTNILVEENGSDIILSTVIKTADIPNNILDIIVGTKSQSSNFGFSPYTRTQIIYNYRLSNYARFGYAVKMNERDGLIVSAITEDTINETTFDHTPNCIQDDTIFDNDTTIFIDSKRDQGIVLHYEYSPSNNESIDNAGKYVLSQQLNSENIPKNINSPKFGQSLAYNNNVIVVGTQKVAFNTGGVYIYTFNEQAQHCIVNNSGRNLFVNKKPSALIDIDSINEVMLLNNTGLRDVLDYIDPIRGKLLKSVSDNIDFINETDPAGYDENTVYWTDDYKNNIWLDLSTLRMLDYNQPDIKYNSEYYGRVFPGSPVDVYIWIESSVPPADYNGSGFPKDFNKFNISRKIDNATNTVVTKYYFWVKNYDLIPESKTLSTLTISDYIINPARSGVSYFAPISDNVIGLYNCNLNQSDDIILHIGYGQPGSTAKKYNSWEFVRENENTSFLPGLPKFMSNDEKPKGLYKKYIESFMGQDEYSNFVPDITLPEILRYGTSDYPKQSMFVDNTQALKIYISYANTLFDTIPLVEQRFLEIIKNSTNTISENWYYKNWWDSGYDDSTKPITTVNTYNDLTLFAQTFTDITEGIIVKVKTNIFGNAEYYIAEQENNNYNWRRIGVENSTIQFNATISNANDIYWIVRWLNEVCYTGDLIEHRNKSLILMFNYIQTENSNNSNNVWLMKSSTVDISHTLRSLLPYKRYKRDNYEFVKGYINEIKPYRVVVKDFSYNFTGNESYITSAADFDLPSYLDLNSLKYKTPSIAFKVNNLKDIIQTISRTNNLVTVTLNQPHNIEPNQYVIVEFPLRTTFNTKPDPLDDTVSQIITFNDSSFVYYNEGINESYILPSQCDIFIINKDQYFYDDNIWLNSKYNDWYNNYGLSIKQDSITVTESGRGYVFNPRIKVEYDSINYPYPRQEIIIDPVILNKQLDNTIVTNLGAGYSRSFDLKVESSTISATITNDDINLDENLITISDNIFEIGDHVYFETISGDAITSLDKKYFYVSIIPKFILVEEEISSIKIYLNSYFDTSYIALFDSKDKAITATNIEYLKIYYAFKQSTDYTEEELTKILVLLESRIPNFENIINYPLRNIDEKVKIISKSGFVTGKISVTAKLGFEYSASPIRSVSTKLKFDRVSYIPRIKDWINNEEYYAAWVPNRLYSVTDRVVYNGFYYRCIVENTTDEFNYDNWERIVANDKTDEFVRYDESLVIFNDTVYKCITSNIDEEFNPDNWELFNNISELTAIDRIKAYYRPNSDMPNSLASILSGIEYPGSTFAGEVFSIGWDGTPWDERRGWDAVINDPDNDTVLKSPPFAIDNDHNVEGTFGKFILSDEKSYEFSSGSMIKLDGLTTLMLPQYDDNDLFNTSDFTIEFWVYRKQESLYEHYVSSGFNQHVFKRGTGYGWYYYHDGVSYPLTNGKEPVQLNKWAHVAFVRFKTDIRMYVNGQLVGLAYVPHTIDYTTSMRISDTSESFIGYMTNFRIIKGKAKYIIPFSAPDRMKLDVTPETAVLLLQNSLTQDVVNAQQIVDVTGSITESAINPFKSDIEVGWYIKGDGLLTYKRIETVNEVVPGTFEITIDGTDGSVFKTSKQFNITNITVIENIVTLTTDVAHGLQSGLLIGVNYSDETKNLPLVLLHDGTEGNTIKISNNISDPDKKFTEANSPVSIIYKPKYEITVKPSYYDVQGGEFDKGYGPEELVAGYIRDQMVMIITTDDNDGTTPWEHKIYVNRFNKQAIINNIGEVLDTKHSYLWWYGDINIRDGVKLSDATTESATEIRKTV